MSGLVMVRDWLRPSRKVSFWSFGFVASGDMRRDVYGRVFGVPNLIKRLQAPDIMAALDVQSSDRVLDFGCGSGYITVEIAKIAREAHGIDVGEHVLSLPVPDFLAGRLIYTHASGASLPFPDAYFDRVLASEVLPMIEDASEFMREIRRVIKRGGLLVVLNGLGHPAIRAAFERNPLWLKLVGRWYPEQMPANYDDYVLRLQRSFGTAVRAFMSADQIERLVRRNGFVIERTIGTPKRVAGSFFSWNQFFMYLRTGKSFPIEGFAWKYGMLRFLSAFDRRPHPAGYLCMAKADPAWAVGDDGATPM